MMSDHVVDIGPGAGVHGGYIVASGTPNEIKNHPKSITGDYLSGRKKIAIPKKREEIDPDKTITIEGASGNNLKSIDVSIPIGLMTCVTGVSGQIHRLHKSLVRLGLIHLLISDCFQRHLLL